MKKRALVALSGGVDSAVAAYLMKESGYDVCGVTLLLCAHGEDNSCCSKRDIEDAASVCEALGTPHVVLDDSESFKKYVADYFVKTYCEGRTPNPCIRCNRFVKFAAICDYARNNGFDLVVTGHYCKVEFSEKYGKKVLVAADDKSKDQSYVLYNLTQEQIDMLEFPLSSLTKEEVRNIAEKCGFVNAHKKDSQDICFIKDEDYSDYIERVTGKTFPDGDFVDEQGKVLGRHRGIIRYTVGQRKGLGLALPAPMYVKSKDMKENKVILCDDNGLFQKELYIKNINLLALEKVDFPTECYVKARYSQKAEKACVTLCKNGAKIAFDTPQRAITPGQSAVMYDGDGVVLGGGEIE